MKKTMLFVLTLLLAFGAMANGQETGMNFYNFEFGGGGARAEGMGKAYYGVSNDITGGSWNPAGNYDMEKTIVSITWTGLNPAGETTVALLDTMAIDHSGGFDEISSFNFATPVRIKGHPFVGSFNYTRNFNVFNQSATRIQGSTIVEFPYYQGTTVLDTIDFDLNQNASIHGGLNSLNFAVGTRLYDKLSAGIAINVYTGFTFTEINQHLLQKEWQYLITQRPDMVNETIITDSNKFSGTNFTLGFMYNTEKYDVGLVVRTPFDLRVSRKEAIYRYAYRADQLIDNGTDVTFFDDPLLKYEIPLIAGIGVGYRQSENLLLAADIEYRPFSGKNVLFRDQIIIKPGQTNQEFFTTVDPEWKDVFAVRLGAEYLLNKDFGTIPIRAGFGYLPVPYSNVELDSAGVETLTGVVDYRVSLGTGMHWEQIKFDIGYSYTFSSLEQEIYNEDGIFTYDEKSRNHVIQFSFTGVF